MILTHRIGYFLYAPCGFVFANKKLPCIIPAKIHSAVLLLWKPIIKSTLLLLISIFISIVTFFPDCSECGFIDYLLFIYFHIILYMLVKHKVKIRGFRIWVLSQYIRCPMRVKKVEDTYHFSSEHQSNFTVTHVWYCRLFWVSTTDPT